MDSERDREKTAEKRRTSTAISTSLSFSDRSFARTPAQRRSRAVSRPARSRRRIRAARRALRVARSGFVFIGELYNTLDRISKCSPENKKAVQHFYCTASLEILTRRQPTFPLVCSIIGAGGLNGRVRNGNGCGPSAMVTGISCDMDLVLVDHQPLAQHRKQPTRGRVTTWT